MCGSYSHLIEKLKLRKYKGIQVESYITHKKFQIHTTFKVYCYRTRESKKPNLSPVLKSNILSTYQFLSCYKVEYIKNTFQNHKAIFYKDKIHNLQCHNTSSHLSSTTRNLYCIFSS